MHLRGASFIRPVAFAFPDDRRTHDLKSQMLFGEGMMVSPVLEPMYYGARSAPLTGRDKTREVYLPKGTWIDFWTGHRLAGGKTVVVDAPIERMPLHVRAGSVIPMGPVMQFSSEDTDPVIELRVYPGADGEYTYYEDAGDGWGYERGEYALTAMRWDDAARKLTIGQRQGGYPGMKETRPFKVVVVGRADCCGAEPAGRAAKLVVYEGRTVVVDARTR